MTLLTVYWAGALFNAKDLIGNYVLSEALHAVSKGRYQCILPQNIELPDQRAVAIRNQDLLTLLNCDLALFNFDGSELDPGTVAEFMYAKMLDIPSVILRTDFRHAGDQGHTGEPWNLMCSFYPRTESVIWSALSHYQRLLAALTPTQDLSREMANALAQTLVETLDRVYQTPAILRTQDSQTIYQWAVRFVGGGLEQNISADDIKALIERKLSRKQICV